RGHPGPFPRFHREAWSAQVLHRQTQSRDQQAAKGRFQASRTKGLTMSMTKYRVDRRQALRLLGGTAAVSLVAVPGARVHAQTLDKVSYQTNWRADAEHGGFYLAVANGIYKKHGIDCDLPLGGPPQHPPQM